MSRIKQRTGIPTDNAISQNAYIEPIYPEPIHFLSFHRIVNALDGREQTLDDSKFEVHGPLHIIDSFLETYTKPDGKYGFVTIHDRNGPLYNLYFITESQYDTVLSYFTNIVYNGGRTLPHLYLKFMETQLETVYPGKVDIPEHYLLGNPKADVIKARVAEYYFFRDMIWEMIFMERNNPYTNDPYFKLARPSDSNVYEWPEIRSNNRFLYVIECNVPTNIHNHDQTCFLSISYDFGMSLTHPIEIELMLKRTEAMQTYPSIIVQLDLSFLGTRYMQYTKDYIRVWLSSLYNAYKVIFLDTSMPTTWQPVINYVNENCRTFINYIHGTSIPENPELSEMMLHFMLKGNSQSSPWLREIQRRDIAQMIMQAVGVPPEFMKKLCKRL
jgi:hypothetical protein